MLIHAHVFINYTNTCTCIYNELHVLTILIHVHVFINYTNTCTCIY